MEQRSWRFDQAEAEPRMFGERGWWWHRRIGGRTVAVVSPASKLVFGMHRRAVERNDMVVGVAVPCYNEARRLDVARFVEFHRSNRHIHFCFVDDGSTDDTHQILQRVAAQEGAGLTVLRLAQNSGKGEAVRQGVLHLLRSGYETVGYIDADLATPPDQLHLLVDALGKDPDTLMAFGSRVRLLGRSIERWAVRHYLGRVFATCASVIVGLAVYDTQCGAKLLRAGAAERVFADPFIGRWVFDVEIFARFVALIGREHATERLIEIPLLEWRDKGDSRIRAMHLLRVPVDLARIALRYPRR